MLVAWFLLWSWPFYGLVAVYLIALYMAIEWDSGPFAAGITVILLLALGLGGDINALQWLAINWSIAIMYAGAYFAAGGGWGVVKWLVVSRRIKRDYQEMRAHFYDSNRIPLDKPVPDNLLEIWHRELVGHFGSDYVNTATPQVRKHKADILMWMTWWPMSFAHTVLHDFIRDIFNAFYNFFSGFMQKMADRMFASVKTELASVDSRFQAQKPSGRQGNY